MAAPSLTYTLSNSTTADADQVMQNFNDLLNGITDGSKDLSISALTCAGTATLNGHVNLGNSSADDITVTGSIASHFVPKTDGTYNLGSTSIGWANLYLSGNSNQITILASSAHAADRTYTIPEAGAAANFVMSQGTATIVGVKTFSSGINLGNSDLTYYQTTSFTVSHSGPHAAQDRTWYASRVGNVVTLTWPQSVYTGNSTGAAITLDFTNFPSWARPKYAIGMPVCVRDAGSSAATPGAIILPTSGNGSIYKTYASSAFTSTASNVGIEGGCISYDFA